MEAELFRRVHPQEYYRRFLVRAWCSKSPHVIAIGRLALCSIAALSSTTSQSLGRLEQDRVVET